jgi:hypothetical protein
MNEPHQIKFGCSDPEELKRLEEMMGNLPVLDGRDQPLMDADGNVILAKDLRRK